MEFAGLTTPRSEAALQEGKGSVVGGSVIEARWAAQERLAFIGSCIPQVITPLVGAPICCNGRISRKRLGKSRREPGFVAV